MGERKKCNGGVAGVRGGWEVGGVGEREREEKKEKTPVENRGSSQKDSSPLWR